jgi:hypothetical protein
MDDDYSTSKLYAGQMGIIAVLVNVLIDNGVISGSEFTVNASSRRTKPPANAQEGRRSHEFWRIC